MGSGAKPDGGIASSLAYSLAVCFAFCVLSTWCTLYNKYIFEHVFKSSNCLLLVQNIVTVFVLLLGRSMKFLTFTPSFGLGDWVCGFAYGLNVMTGLWSLVFVNIAMFSTLKRCTLVASWVLEFFCNRTSTTNATLAPCLFMLGATIFAGFFDLQFSLPGYLLAGVSCIAQGGSFELGRRMTVQNKGVCSVLLINSLATIMLQFTVISMSGELGMLNPFELDWNLVFHFSLNSVSCLLMNYTIFLNCQVNSPLAHTVTGNVKAVSVTIIGVMIFTTKIQGLGWVGIGGNCLGAGWFSYVKLQATLAKQRESSSSSNSTAGGDLSINNMNSNGHSNSNGCGSVDLAGGASCGVTANGAMGGASPSLGDSIATTPVDRSPPNAASGDYEGSKLINKRE